MRCDLERIKGLESVRSSLKEIEKVLIDQIVRREKLLKDSRDVVTSSSRAIVNLHNARLKEAEDELKKARRVLSKLRKVGKGPISRYLLAPETEYVEACVVNAIVRGEDVPSITSLNSSPESYVLGLLDSIGELKRLVLDSIMHGNLARAKKYFKAMEEIYSLLSPFAVFDHVVNGARRKIDVARILIEDTRGVLTEETRRERLVSSMERLYREIQGNER